MLVVADRQQLGDEPRACDHIEDHRHSDRQVDDERHIEEPAAVGAPIDARRRDAGDRHDVERDAGKDDRRGKGRNDRLQAQTGDDDAIEDAAGEADADAYNRELQVEGLGAAWALPSLELLMEEPARKAPLR